MSYSLPLQSATDPDDIIPMDEALEAARTLGTEHGHAAGTWAFDGNTPHETYVTVLRGIEAGDPAVLDSLHEPSMRGDYTERDLCEAIDVDYDLSETREVDQIADAYLDEARSAFWAEVERAARCQVTS